MDAFPASFRAARKARGLSLRQVAKRAGIDYTNVVAIERGRRPPSLRTVIRLCLAGGIRPDELLGFAPAGGGRGV